MMIEDYFKTHYGLNDNMIFQRYGDLWDKGDKVTMMWIQMNIRKASRDTGYYPIYLVDKIGVDLYCHFTKDDRLKKIINAVNTDYMVAFCKKIVWSNGEKIYRNIPYPYFIFTKETIEPGIGLNRYEERMYKIVG